MSQSWSESNADAVLASIKRLVAQSSTRADMPPPKPDAPAKLVLTPAQRVAEPAQEASAAVEDQAIVPPTSPDSVWSLEDRIAELEQAVGAQEDSWEPDGSEGAEQETPQKFVFQHRRVEDAPAPVAEPGEAPEPQAVEDVSVNESQPAGRDPVDGNIVAMSPTRQSAPRPEALTDPEDRPEVVAATAEAPSGTAGSSEPDQPASPANPLAAEALSQVSPEVLRALVAEIVREELQGQLGERITRNVRKLVRQEIHRALMARDLENGG